MLRPMRRMVVGLLLWVGLLGCGDGGKEPKVDERPLDCDAEIETFEGESRQHVQGRVDYVDLPPTGGEHNQCWTDWGVHDREVAAENWVHNLEHGGIAFLYNCPEGCEDERLAMQALSDGRSFAIVTQYSKLRTRFAVVAWGRRILTDCYDEELFTDFYDEYQHKGPEASPDPPLPRPEVCR